MLPMNKKASKVGSDSHVKLTFQFFISLSYAGISAFFGDCPDQVQRVFLRPALSKPPLANCLYYSLSPPAIKEILALTVHDERRYSQQVHFQGICKKT
jgi:hypothetical protein